MSIIIIDILDKPSGKILSTLPKGSIVEANEEYYRNEKFFIHLVRHSDDDSNNLNNGMLENSRKPVFTSRMDSMSRWKGNIND